MTNLYKVYRNICKSVFYQFQVIFDINTPKFSTYYKWYFPISNIFDKNLDKRSFHNLLIMSVCSGATEKGHMALNCVLNME